MNEPTHIPRIPKYGRDEATDDALFLVGCICGWVAPGNGPNPIPRRLRECKAIWQAHVDESEGVAA